MYDRDFKLKFISDITMLGKLFVTQILASKHKFLKAEFLAYILN
jgi:hypothetical protein